MKDNLPSTLDNRFRQVWQSFATTYSGLRLFSKQLPALADRLDEQTIGEMAEVMAGVFGDFVRPPRVGDAHGKDHLQPSGGSYLLQADACLCHARLDVLGQFHAFGRRIGAQIVWAPIDFGVFLFH